MGMQRMSCDCGSAEYPQRQYDARGIYLCSTCERCHQTKMGRYRPDVLRNPNYCADEEIEED